MEIQRTSWNTTTPLLYGRSPVDGWSVVASQLGHLTDGKRDLQTLATEHVVATGGEEEGERRRINTRASVGLETAND